MIRITITSVVIHAILLFALAPWLITRMEFDSAEEVQRTEEVRRRELRRQEVERARRERQKLTEDQSRQLRREAERRNRDGLQREVDRLRQLRDQFAAKHRRELEEFRQRTREDVITLEQTDLSRIARNLQSEVDTIDLIANERRFVAAGYRNGERALDGQIDDLRVYREFLSDSDIANPPSDRLARHWRFESNVVDEVSGEEMVTLERGARFVEAEIEGERAVAGNGEHSFALLGDQQFGDRFTIILWVKAEADAQPQCLVANCYHWTHHAGFRLEVVPAADDARSTGLQLVTKGHERYEQGKPAHYGPGTTSTLPDALPLGEWARVAMRFDRDAPKAEIFVNGTNVTAAGSEVSANTFTHATTIDGTLQEQAKEIAELIQETAPTPENAADFGEKVADLMKRLDEKSAVNSALNDIPERITKATELARQLSEKLDALSGKLDMAAMNDTSTATADFDTEPSTTSESAAEMYDESLALEQQIAEANADILAAEEAAAQNTSFAEARSEQSATTPARPDIASQLSKSPLETVGQLGAFRKALAQAQTEIQDMNARAASALGLNQGQGGSSTSGQTRDGARFATQAARITAAQGGQGHGNLQGYGNVVNMIGFGGTGSGGSSEGMRSGSAGGGSNMEPGAVTHGPGLEGRDILGKALPGRRFTRDSLRRGWLYIDTWYVIGPWGNRSTIDYTNVHPPEREINFDARYGNGKFAGQRDHPDHAMKWEFYQSDQARCQPPRVYADSTYYAYTDIWFEQPRDMLIAIATDDAARVWLNGEIIWQDEGISAWNLGEGYRRVHFKKGYNDLLVRIENGPRHCIWSVLLCPPEVVDRE